MIKIRGLLDKLPEETVNYKDLIDKYDQNYLWFNLLGFSPDLDKNYLSIFRKEDSAPKCRFVVKDNMLLFKDNATYQDKLYFTVFDAASILWRKEFKEVLKEFKSRLDNNKTSYVRPRKTLLPKNDFKCIIKFKYLEWTKNPFSYLGVSIETLKSDPNIYNIAEYYTNSKSDRVLRKNRFYNPKYVDIIGYLFPSGNIKLHFLNQKFKTYTNTQNYDFYGQHLIEKYDIDKPLVLTKGLKEYLILLNEGVQVIGLMNEGITIPQKYVDIFDKFRVVYTVMDRDKAGIRASLKYANYGYHPYYLPNLNDDLGDEIVLNRMKHDCSFQEMIRIFTKQK